MQSRKFAGRIGRFLRNYKILQILGKDLILSKKTKACYQKNLTIDPGLAAAALF
jgi:hypothetical protein